MCAEWKRLPALSPAVHGRMWVVHGTRNGYGSTAISEGRIGTGVDALSRKAPSAMGAGPGADLLSGTAIV